MSDIAIEIPTWMIGLEGAVVFDGIGIGTLEITTFEYRPAIAMSYLGGGRRLFTTRDKDERPIAAMTEPQILKVVTFIGFVPREQALYRRILEEKQ